MIVTIDYGQAQFSGTLTTLTSAKGINNGLLSINGRATHWVPYSTGGVGALVDNEVVTGGTSSKTARIVKVIRDNGTGGSSDSGILLLKDPSGTFVAETLTGGTSTGTAVIASDLIPIRFWSQPKSMIITVETAAVNVSFDGVTPTAAAGTNLGIMIDAGGSIRIDGIESIRAFKAINYVNASGSIVKYVLNF